MNAVQKQWADCGDIWNYFHHIRIYFYLKDFKRKTSRIQHYKSTGTFLKWAISQCVLFRLIQFLYGGKVHDVTLCPIVETRGLARLGTGLDITLQYINKIQQDATVCRYLFTAKLLYMFRASITPIIRSTSGVLIRPRWRKAVEQIRWYDLYQKLQLQFYVLLMMGAMDTRNM